MATITIRNLDETVKTRLRIQAALHGRSLENEARDILSCAVSLQPQPQPESELVHAGFSALAHLGQPEASREPKCGLPAFAG